MTAATAHAQFIEARRAYLGASDIAAVAGLDGAFGSPLSVYMDKVCPEQAEDRDNLPMRRGLWLERFIADEFARVTGYVAYRCKPLVRTDWGFPAGAALDFCLARRDRPRTAVAVLEAKAALSYYARQQWKAPDPIKGYTEGDLPDAYYAQVEWQLAVAEATLPHVRKAFAAADTGDEDLTIVPVKPNKAVQAKLVEAGRKFWTKHVLAKVPPEPNGSDRDGEILRGMWPETIPDPPVYIEDPAAEKLLSDYLAHKFKAEEHGREADKAKQQIQALMGEHEAAVIGGWRTSWKPQTAVRIDTTRLKKERPDVAAEYAKESTSRRFNVKEV